MFKQLIKRYSNSYNILQHNIQPTLFFKFNFTTHMMIRCHQCIGQQFHSILCEVTVATDDAPSCEVPSRRRTIKPPAWQKDYYMF